MSSSVARPPSYTRTASCLRCAERLVLRLRLELALGDQPLQRLAQPLEAALHQLVVGLDEQHAEAGLGRDLHDAGAHETAADHPDVLDGHESFLWLEVERSYFERRPGSGAGS